MSGSLFFKKILLGITAFAFSVVANAQNNSLDAVQAKQLAKEAYLFGAPLVYISTQSDYDTHVSKAEGTKAPINQFVHHRKFMDASNKSVIGFNVDNLYSLAQLNLEKEPMVLFVPPMDNRFWIMQLIDAWNCVPAAPGSREYGGKGGTFAIVGPNWKGTLPKGIKKLQMPTNLIMLSGRIYCTGGTDYKFVNDIQDKIKLVPLSSWGKKYSPPTNVPLKNGVDGVTLVSKQFISFSMEQYFSRLNKLMLTNPPFKADKEIMDKIKKIGVYPSLVFDVSKFSPEIKLAMEEGFKEGWSEVQKEIERIQNVKTGWALCYDGGRYGQKYAYRAAWTIGGVGANLVEDAIYPAAIFDDKGELFNGENKYTLTFPKGQLPPANAFWSLTIYDSNVYLIDNELNRYALGDRSNLNYNEDGSLTIYLQNKAPEDPAKLNNWLPTTQKGLFRLAMRLYHPKENVIKGEWIPPAVKKVE